MEGCTKNPAQASAWAIGMVGETRPIAIFEAQTALGSFYFATAVKPELIGHDDARIRLPKKAAPYLQHLYHIATLTWHGR